MIQYAYKTDFTLYNKAAREKESNTNQHAPARLSENHKDRLRGTSPIRGRRTEFGSAIDAIRKNFKGTLVTATIAAEYSASDIFTPAG
jgi:hypothetical protein